MTLTFNKDSLVKKLLLIIIITSWILYPFVMIYFLARPLIQLIFSILFLLTSFLLFVIKKPTLFKLSNLQKAIIFLWLIYLGFLLIASIQSDNSQSISYFFKFLLKFAFFIILTIYMNSAIIKLTMRIYAHIMLVCVILAIFVAFGVALNFLQPIFQYQTTDAAGFFRNHNYFLGAVYGYTKVQAPFVLYRLESFMGEPGSFALVLAPSLFWFFYDKKIIKAVIILLGIIGTFSVGIAFCFLFLYGLFVLTKKKNIKKIFLLSTIILISLPLLNSISNLDNNKGLPEYIVSKFVGSRSSLGDRFQEISKTAEYLSSDPLGTGAGVGMTTIRWATSNGYVKAFLESGYFGGLFYLVLFTCMGLQALFLVISSRKYSFSDSSLFVSLGLSVLSVLFMGMQRDQPDLSFWHMWLYASLFVACSSRFSKTIISQEKMILVYLCNAIDESTKLERDVHGDSPAATNKVFGIAKALTTQDVDVHILSFGKGKQTGSKKKFHEKSCGFLGFHVHYAAFWHYPFITHIIGSLSMASIFFRLQKNNPGKFVIISYNRLWQYLPTLLLSKLFSNHVFLDLEDGSVYTTNSLIRLKDLVSMDIFNWLCNRGALLSAKSLKYQVRTNHTFVCYGIYESQPSNKENWNDFPIRIIFGGSLLEETGASLLIEAINKLESNSPEIKDKILISITGQGVLSDRLRLFAESRGRGWINYLGNVDRDSYIRIVSNSHLGLCLKISSTEMGKTTFPSKIIEYASYGLAIASTKVSDVTNLLDDNSAIFLVDETPDCLAEIIKKIATNKFDLHTIAINGQSRIFELCNIDIIGKQLKEFIIEGIR